MNKIHIDTAGTAVVVVVVASKPTNQPVMGATANEKKDGTSATAQNNNEQPAKIHKNHTISSAL